MNDFVAVETRKSRFLSVAPFLAERLKLDQLTPAAIAAEARLPLHEFLEEFGSIGDYVAEAHRRFLDGLLDRIVRDSGELGPGVERIMRSSLSQLDACLEQRALRAWFAEARRKVPRVAEEIHQRNRSTAMLISIELSALRCKRPMIAARLYGAMMLEAAQMEADAGGPIAELRHGLREFLNLWVQPRATWAQSAPAAL